MQTVKKQKILIVDDVPENIQILVELLKDEYKVIGATSGEKALSMADKEPRPDLILLDIMMPDMDGYEVCMRLKSSKETCLIPIIFITAVSDLREEYKGLNLGAIDYITKPFSPELVKARLRNHLELKQARDNLADMVLERTRKLELTQAVMIESLGTLAEYRDPETGGHIKRTQNYVKALAKQLQKHAKYADAVTDEFIELLYISAPLHDVGKVGVPDYILKKPGKLTDEEYETIKKHTLYGYETLQKAELRLGENSFIRTAKEIAYAHHERWDGAGYPRGLSGADIPIAGRLMALADVYDALISKRVYKEPFSHEDAVDIILNGDARTKQGAFDPDVVEAFREIQHIFRNIAITYADYDIERNNLNTRGAMVENILLVDDHALNLEIMKAQIEGLGYTVETAGNGKEALDKLWNREFDLILTDLDMPVMDGYMFIKELMNSGINIPVLAATANDYEMNEELALKLGFDGYMLKPFDDVVLINKINEIIKDKI